MKYGRTTPLWSQKTVAIIFFIYSAALNFFAEGNDGCLDVTDFFFCFAYRVINPCCIHYNNTLQEFRSLIGVACQMRDREYNSTSFVIVCEILRHGASTAFLYTSGCGRCCAHYVVKCLGLRKR